MKKLILTLLIVFAITSAYAQENLAVSLCGDTNNTKVKEKCIEKTISLENFLNCLDLVVNKKDWKVTTYLMSLKTKENTVYEMRGSQGKITERMTILIKKYKPQKIYLEKFELSNGENKSVEVKPLILMIKY